MNSLVVAQIAESERARFEVVRERDGKRAAGVEVPSPYRFGVRNRPADNLMSCLWWYFEEFFDYPFPPRTEQAVNIEDALEAWGRQAFDALFTSGEPRDWMIEATRGGVFRLKILSDDPATLSWPWEALYDPQIGVLAQCAQVERRLNCQIPDPPPLSDELPKDRINILLVTARPYDVDAQFRSISYPLIDLIESGRVAARVHLLRPPTFDNLREHLARHPHTYHVLHFDGHGSYHEGAGVTGSGMLAGRACGELVFEDKYGNPAPVTGDELGNLLRGHSVPIVVLNACQSAMIDQRAFDPFASVAGAMSRSGIRSVVAMAYSLYVRAAQEFLPAFYEALFQTGSVSEAARRGRLAMSAHPQRSRIAPDVKLRDWLVPVVYQEEKLELSFDAPCQRLPLSTKEPRDFDLPHDAKLRTRYAFTGRDGALLELERAMRREPAGILINGLAGVGKTTLAQAFVHWLRVTDGLGHGCFWFAFDDIHSADHVFNEIGRSIFGPQFGLEGKTASIDRLVGVLRDKGFVIVWDNCESVRGLPESGMPPMLSASDQALLRQFLTELRGTSTKVLITSRSQEDWLFSPDCFRLRLRGLRREEMWDFAAQILDKAGVEISRRDPALAEVLESLGGHPLAMQAVLPQLTTHNISEVRVSLEQNFANLSSIADPVERRLYASLKFIQQSLADNLTGLLIPLALHERFVDTAYLETMADSLAEGLNRAQIERFTSVLVTAGLLTNLRSSIYEIHPLLPSFLRVEVLRVIAPAHVEKWTRAFVDVMAPLAYEAAAKESHEQRPRFAIHHANFRTALLHARKLGDYSASIQLSESLGCYAYNLRNFAHAKEFFDSVVNGSLGEIEDFYKAASYDFLAKIARATGDFVAAKGWYLKILELKDKIKDEQLVNIYPSLGQLAAEQGEFVEAANWYFQLLEESKRIGDERIEAAVYRELAIVATEQRDFVGAKEWYRKSLQVVERLGDQNLVAKACYALGLTAQLEGDFASAKNWFLKVLEIADDKNAASTYCGLGNLAREQRELAAAESWYRKSLEIAERLGEEESASDTYYQLGVMAYMKLDIRAAEQHFLSSLQLSERIGHEYNAARNYRELAAVAKDLGDFAIAEKWCRKGLDISQRLRYEGLDAGFYKLLGTFAFHQNDYGTTEKWYLRALEVSEKLGDEHSVAGCYRELGTNALLGKGDFAEAGKWYLKAVRMFKRLGDAHAAAKAYMFLGISLAYRGRWLQGGRFLSKALAGFLKANDTAHAQLVARNFLAVLSKAPAAVRGKLRAMWKDARLGPSTIIG